MQAFDNRWELFIDLECGSAKALIGTKTKLLQGLPIRKSKVPGGVESVNNNGQAVEQHAQPHLVIARLLLYVSRLRAPQLGELIT